jgi:hypothetical protein
VTWPDPLNAFPHTWSAEILPRPPLIAPARQFVYPQQIAGEEDALARGALLAQIRPAAGGGFLATCALGFRDPSLPSGLWSCPAPDELLAVAGGYAYRIDTLHPESPELLEQRPAVALFPIPEHNLLLLAGFHDVLALGEKGVCWRTGRLSWEGLTVTGLQGDLLHGTGWDMYTDRELPFTVDLRTGAHHGGGYLVSARSSGATL